MQCLTTSQLLQLELGILVNPEAARQHMEVCARCATSLIHSKATLDYYVPAVRTLTQRWGLEPIPRSSANGTH